MQALGVILRTSGFDLVVDAMMLFLVVRFKSSLSFCLGSSLDVLSSVGKLNEDLLSILEDLSIYNPFKELISYVVKRFGDLKDNN